jgi:hypothetical protein
VCDSRREKKYINQITVVTHKNKIWSNMQSYNDHNTITNIESFKSEEQQGDNIISTLDNQGINNIPNDEQVCIYKVSTR